MRMYKTYISEPREERSWAREAEPRLAGDHLPPNAKFNYKAAPFVPCSLLCVPLISQVDEAKLMER